MSTYFAGMETIPEHTTLDKSELYEVLMAHKTNSDPDDDSDYERFEIHTRPGFIQAKIYPNAGKFGITEVSIGKKLFYNASRHRNMYPVEFVFDDVIEIDPATLKVFFTFDKESTNFVNLQINGYLKGEMYSLEDADLLHALMSVDSLHCILGPGLIEVSYNGSSINLSIW